MARFFLLLNNCDEVGTTQEARDFPDVTAAIAAATDELRDFLADQVRHGYLDTDLGMEIRDERGRSVATGGVSQAIMLRD